MTKPQISIIIPIYNIEQFLPACLESVRNQSFTDWECILVDDGSLDSSGNICDEYVKLDGRFRSFHKSNGGISSARNIGIKWAEGEWLLFIDGDDSMPKNALSIYVERITDKADIVMAGYIMIDEKGTSIQKAKRVHEETMQPIDGIREMYQPKDFSYQGYIWCKLFRRDIIKEYSLSFNENIHYNEDRLFVIEYLCKCSQFISYTTQAVYRYALRKNSAMGKLRTSYVKEYATDLDAYALMYKAIKSITHNKEILKMAKDGICFSFYYNLKLMQQFRAFDPDIHQRLRKSIASCNLTGYLIKYAFLHMLQDTKSAFLHFAGDLLRIFRPAIIMNRQFA